jgi:hypothetical protein
MEEIPMARHSAARSSLAGALFALAALPALAAIPADEEPSFMLSASGTNLFQCKARIDDANAYAWHFVAPDLTLFEGSRTAGTHKAASQFESGSDRTSLFGVLSATQPAGGNNMPWARMRAVPAGDSGMFAGVTTIQRVNTAGGVAPAEGCNAASVGNETRVNFSADYFFYRRRGAG